jgi:uncharacterized protein YjbI with pentapeptide repeats
MEPNMIGAKIVKARKKTNLSQSQLAEQLFISPQAVGKWERGESIPDIITIHRLAEIFGVDLNYFSENFTSRSSETILRETESSIVEVKGEEERQLLKDFSGSNLPDGDFEGVIAHNMNFNGSALRGTSFAGADMTGSSFKASDARETNFDRTDLTDCSFFAVDLRDAGFNKTILVKTDFNASDLAGARFADVKLTGVKFSQIDLRKTIFERCAFHGVDFKQADLRSLCLDRHTFTSVKFDKAALSKATFKGSTLKNVSFRPTFALTNKYYRDVRSICFEGAMMDKLTYASLKGMGAELSDVTMI